jgi:small subunit ribosomal protein S20
MPTHKSAIKRMRQSEEKKQKNRQTRSTLRTAVKNTIKAATEGTKEEVKALHKKSVSLIGKAATKGLMHKKAAARKTSRLAKAVKKASTAKK